MYINIIFPFCYHRIKYAVCDAVINLRLATEGAAGGFSAGGI